MFAPGFPWGGIQSSCNFQYYFVIFLYIALPIPIVIVPVGGTFPVVYTEINSHREGKFLCINGV